jgi:hypothetical protein
LVIALVLIGLVFSCVKRSIPIPPPPHHDSTTTPPVDTTAFPPADTTGTVDLRLGLVLWLPFDGNMADSSGNNNMTEGLNGAGLVSDEHGSASGAFGANGTNQVVLVTNNGSIKFDTAYSVSFNVQSNDNNSLHMYISMINWTNGNAPTFGVGTSCPAYLNRVTIAANDSVAGCDNDGRGTNTALADTTNFNPQPGSWYNVIEVYHRGSVTTYVNGQIVGIKSGPGTRALDCLSEQVVVGGWWSGDPENLNGKIDDVRIYNRVLTGKEIARLATRP